jgi:hypothetical protein
MQNLFFWFEGSAKKNNVKMDNVTTLSNLADGGGPL